MWSTRGGCQKRSPGAKEAAPLRHVELIETVVCAHGGRVVMAKGGSTCYVFGQAGRELVLLAEARHRAGQPAERLQPLLDEAHQLAKATGAHLIDQEIARYALVPPG